MPSAPPSAVHLVLHQGLPEALVLVAWPVTVPAEGATFGAMATPALGPRLQASSSALGTCPKGAALPLAALALAGSTFTLLCKGYTWADAAWHSRLRRPPTQRDPTYDSRNWSNGDVGGTGHFAPLASSTMRPAQLAAKVSSHPGWTNPWRDEAAPPTRHTKRGRLSRTRVWLHMCRPDLQRAFRLYDILLHSLYEALSDAGASVVVSHLAQDADLFRNLTSVARKMSTWVVAFGWFRDTRAAQGVLATAAGLGARVVLYQTEPSPPVIRLAGRFSAAVGAVEVWDYSRWNLKLLSATHLVKRYMPPGYTRGFDFGVDVHSTVANVTAVGIMMGLGERRLDPYRASLGGSLVARPVFTPKAYRDFFTEVPIQLNVHRKVGFKTMESTRMAVLLSNSACVISAPVAAAEEHTWKGLVRFASRDNITSILSDVRKDVVGCRVRSRKEYMKRFSGTLLLKKSGILQKMQEMEGGLHGDKVHTGGG